MMQRVPPLPTLTLRLLIVPLLLMAGAGETAEPAGTTASAAVDKTLIAWVSLKNLTQQGGSALTIQSGEQFDGLVFGERAAQRWMAGSDFFRRTEADQSQYPVEDAAPGTLVQIAAVYDGDVIRLYRNAQLYAEYAAENIDLLNVGNHIAVFGLRHVGAGSGTPLAGVIEDARIYASALSPEQLAALKPDQPSALKPLAWWDFEGERVRDRAGRFEHSAARGNVTLTDGRLHLDGEGYLVAARSAADARLATREAGPSAPGPPYVPETPAWPQSPPPEWLTFHLAHPGPGDARPGDPNCAFDYMGQYHLHYIYRNHTGFVFAHVSSEDLVHWTWHPTVLAPPTTGHGMFSGTGFFTKDGKPAIIYHGQGSGRNWIQFPQDDQFDSWSEPMAVEPRNPDGSVPDIRHWDPDCWLNGQSYYAISGGQNPQLMKSTDLQEWTYLGDLLHADFPQDLGVARDEDISCANMFRIGNRWMLLCISHRLGCRYYLGEFQDEKFLPDTHAMLSWGSNRVFAPESMLTRDGRRVMWAWILPGSGSEIHGVQLGHRIAPSGVQSLPRELELPEDGRLRMRPLRELASLRDKEMQWDRVDVNDGEAFSLKGLSGSALELEIRFAAPLPEQCAIELLGDQDGEGSMQILTGSGRETLAVGAVRAPFQLAADEALTLRIFIDQNLVEVFANDRQAVVYAHDGSRARPNIRIIPRGGAVTIDSATAWTMKSIYP